MINTSTASHKNFYHRKHISQNYKQDCNIVKKARERNIQDTHYCYLKIKHSRGLALNQSAILLESVWHLKCILESKIETLKIYTMLQINSIDILFKGTNCHSPIFC